jgi:hypothetical protein
MGQSRDRPEGPQSHFTLFKLTSSSGIARTNLLSLKDRKKGSPVSFRDQERGHVLNLDRTSELKGFRGFSSGTLSRVKTLSDLA